MHYKKGELKEEDVSYDSDFMLNAIPEVAQKWRTIGTRFGVPAAHLNKFYIAAIYSDEGDYCFRTLNLIILTTTITMN